MQVRAGRTSSAADVHVVMAGDIADWRRTHPVAALTIIDVGSDTALADDLARDLLPHVTAIRPQEWAHRADTMLGVLAIDDDAWPAPPTSPPSAFRPRQTWEVGLEDASHKAVYGDAKDARVSGVIVWAGAGVTRIDALQRLDGCGRGGDGVVLLSQAVAEVLCKLGKLPKFGA